MAGPRPSELDYLTVSDVERLHSFVVGGDVDTEAGVSNRGAIEYATSFVREGHFGKRPDTIHEAAFQLMRLLVANHPFVDGNKRTALLSTVAFYALNGYEFEYDREIKATLKALGTDERSVDAVMATERLAAKVEPFGESTRADDGSIGEILRRHFRRRRYNADDDDRDE